MVSDMFYLFKTRIHKSCTNGQNVHEKNQAILLVISRKKALKTKLYRIIEEINKSSYRALNRTNPFSTTVHTHSTLIDCVST